MHFAIKWLWFVGLALNNGLNAFVVRYGNLTG